MRMMITMRTTMAKHKHYPLVPGKERPHDMVTIPKIEYEQLKEIARRHKIMLERIEEILPTVIADYKKEPSS